ncbi:PREDICTED: uncharacterized protein LOC109485252 isoform X3 [Branchiostoma belcheri]|uniref:Uncharacterized protein LOC109485252 isoform X3 n=1 Tax=Branchiostoma belcheri TaxID=7741 RepID=A0A6P5AMJ2_BRABE|nr:PREDICTED: uncharacterized protein LOC109485252 isoform X3 [Branchiostoma belcheri]XP_019644281.1 PREDICTED: uncharacterized protein LOC109485252 isoform X3 [Branchiostoma belcheri]
MSELPGYVGYPWVGDNSLEFYRDPVNFMEKRIQDYSSRIFQARFINRPTVFVGSAEAVKKLLNEKTQHFDMGYKALWQGLYGENVLFSDGTEAIALRALLIPLFNREAVSGYQNTVERICDRTLQSIPAGKPVKVYELLKQMSTEISMGLFLDIEREADNSLGPHVSQLMTQHWHGIISMPANLKLPTWGGNWESGYSKAQEAKDELLQIIRDRIGKNKHNNVLGLMKTAGFRSEDEIYWHLLLFVSALVPKAFSSLFTSFTLQLAGPSKASMRQKALEDETFLEHILLEVQRLWPPFIGGRRLVRQEFTLAGYRIPKEHGLMYVTHTAHRDPQIFPEPHSFKPERWSTCNAGHEGYLCAFGGGPRRCVGTQLVQLVLKHVTKYLLRNFHWEVTQAEIPPYKWLPVSRPTVEDQVIFTPRDSSGEEVEMGVEVAETSL